MSHIVAIKLKIHDLDALIAATKALGVEFMRDQKTHRAFASNVGQCDYAIRVPGNDRAYEVGVVREATGDYTLQSDFWRGGYGLEAKVGKDGQKLIQEYAAQVTQKWAYTQGLRVTRRITTDGRIIMEAS